MNPARVHRTCHLSDRDTLDSIDRVSSAKLRKMQNFEDAQSGQPQAWGPAHLSQSSPTASWFLKSRLGSTTSANSQTDRGFDRDRPSIQPSIAERDRLRSTRTQSRTTGLGVPPSIPEKTKPESQTFPINALSSPQYSRVQSQQLRSSEDASNTSPAGKAVQSPGQSSRSQLSRSVNATDLPQGIHGVRTLRSITSNDDIYQHPNTTALPQPLSSHPPFSDDSLFVKIPKQTWDLRNTDPQEFRRRVDAYEHGQKLRTRAPITRVEFEAVKFLNEDTEPLIDDEAFVSLATRIRDYGVASAGSIPGSPASDETVTPYDPYRRRVTQTRWIDNETGDPLPPAAPSPPPDAEYRSDLPVYPPTLVSSGSEVVMQRDASNSRHTRVNQISSGNESVRRITPLDGSATSLSRHGALDEHNSENELLLGHEGAGGGANRLPQRQNEENQGEQVRAVHLFPCLSTFPFQLSIFPIFSLCTFSSTTTPLFMKPYTELRANTRVQKQIPIHPTAPRTSNAKPITKFQAMHKLRAMGRKVSDTINGGGGKRVSSLP